MGNYLVPKAALEAYSLLYDIKQKKPALDLRQGAFYNSIPDISIKVNEKEPETGILKGVIIYDHRGRTGNKEVIIADSGLMYTILNDQYLKLELFNGYNYREGSTGESDFSGKAGGGEDSYRKTKFSKSQIVFDLSSFGLNRTDKRWFQSNRMMRNMSELETDIDSVTLVIQNEQIAMYASAGQLYSYHFKNDSVTWPAEIKNLKKKKDSIALAKRRADENSKAESYRVDEIKPLITLSKKDSLKSDSIFFSAPYSVSEISVAVAQARLVKSQLLSHNANLKAYGFQHREFTVQWHKILAQSIACIAMFLIGAPLGAIIKKGGLGVPVLMSILFFIVFYVLSLIGEKWAKQATVSVPAGMWMANFILVLIGLVFLRQARADARLFDSDFYAVVWDRIARRFIKQPKIAA